MVGAVVYLSLLTGVAMSNTNAVATPDIPAKDHQITMAGSPFGIAGGFLYGYQGTPAYEFMPQLRQLGSGFTKIYLFWNQIEPEPGKFDWTAVDKFVNQLESPEEGLISLFSASQWATVRASALLPPSPAKNPDDYYRFVYEVVKHCKGRVRYWQNDAEPNNPVYWSGTKEEFVAELRVFYKAVKAADPSAVVVVGGYDGLFAPPGTRPFPNQEVGLTFFDYVLEAGRDAFDLFDLRLYGDPYTIAARVDFMRQKMLALGYDKPIVSTEYGGPNLFEFPQNRQYLPVVSSWTQSVATSGAEGEPPRNPIAELYEKMSSLAPQTQMFMIGCPAELEAKYQRIQARGIVMRNLFALSAGVQKTLYWYLPATPASGAQRFNIMALMYGKIGLIELQDGALSKRLTGADTFERMTKALAGVKQVRKIEVSGRPSIVLFEVDRGGRGPVHVVWERRDAFTGEDSPAVPFEWSWRSKAAKAEDALGHRMPVEVRDGKLHLSVSLTPIFFEAGR
jgi:hypothetical protein